MSYETIEITKQNKTATVVLNRAEVHNALNEQLMKELTACLQELAHDINTRCIILTGKGKSFCAGADLNWMKSMVSYSQEENIRDSTLLLNLYETMYQNPKPIIARVNGHAFGGGIGLFAACDLAVAVPSCLFAFSEVNLGIIPAVISTYVARRIPGISLMRRLFITGERFTATDAEKYGLIDKVVDDKDLDATIEKYVTILQTSGPLAITEIKKLADAYEHMGRKEFQEHTVETIARLRISLEGQEGINAFLEKRPAQWSE